MARTTTQRKRRRRARDSSAKSSVASSDSEGLSEDDREEADRDEEERRWQTRRGTQDSKRKGKELVKEEDEEESRSRSSRSKGDGEESVQEEQQQQQQKDGSQVLDEICGICLSEGGNERGKLDCCDHFFCFGCIMEWAKVESRCPMCKQRFLTVTRPVSSGHPRGRNRSFRIPTRDQVYEPSEEEIRLFTDPYQNTVCIECQEAGDEGLLLLCDRCDAAAHTYCVGLGRSVPRGDWFCQACQALECESSEDDEDDITFDTIDAEEEGGSGTESVLTLLVADLQPNLFAGRTRRSAASQGPAPLRRSSRRRARRSITSSDAPMLSEALISMSSTPRRGLIPALMESYGAARTLFRQRQVQATVQNRLQDIRDNWHRYQSGEFQFASAGYGVGSSGRGSEEPGSFPSSSTPRGAHGVRSAAAITTDGENEEVPAASRTRGIGRSSEDVDADKAWAMMEQARSLQGNSAGASQPCTGARAGSAAERRNMEVKQDTPVASRTRERHAHGDVHARSNSSRAVLNERHSQGGVHARPDVPMSTRSSRSRDNDISGSEDKPAESCLLDSSCGGDNSRSAYYLRESNQMQTSRTHDGSIRSPTLRESRNGTGILQVRSTLDVNDNSRGSWGVSTRRREPKEPQAFSQGRSILDDKDNSRSSTGTTTRRRESPALQGKETLDDQDNSRSSSGPITRRETERYRLQALSHGRDHSMPRNAETYEQRKLMKAECNGLVQVALKPILDEGKIDKSQYKYLARCATHTILSSLGVDGLKDVTDIVPLGTVTCHHEAPTSSCLMPGCCNLCVQRHVKRFVKSLVKEKINLR